jgi:hypothetical protein
LVQAAQKVPGEELFGSERCKGVGIVEDSSRCAAREISIGAQLSNGQGVTFDNAPMILASQI